MVREIFKNYNIELSVEQETQFQKYYQMLIEKNKVMNLTAITEERDVVTKHFLDSVLPYEQFMENAKVVDVGSGAGFPALPLKIIRTDLKIEMIDSLNKRVFFLNDVIKALGLKNISAIHSRAEDFAKIKRESFDIAIARAVAPLNTLVEYLLPLIKIGGYAIIYKSSKLEEELLEANNAIDILGAKIEKVIDFCIKEGDLQRKVLILRKCKETPKKYPRDKNRPKLDPIK